MQVITQFKAIIKEFFAKWDIKEQSELLSEWDLKEHTELLEEFYLSHSEERAWYAYNFWYVTNQLNQLLH